MAPVVAQLQRSATLEPIVVVTGQHRAMLDQVNALFGAFGERELWAAVAETSLPGTSTRTTGVGSRGRRNTGHLGAVPHRYDGRVV